MSLLYLFRSVRHSDDDSDRLGWGMPRVCILAAQRCAVWTDRLEHLSRIHHGTAERDNCHHSIVRPWRDDAHCRRRSNDTSHRSRSRRTTVLLACYNTVLVSDYLSYFMASVPITWRWSPKTVRIIIKRNHNILSKWHSPDARTNHNTQVVANFTLDMCSDDEWVSVHNFTEYNLISLVFYRKHRDSRIWRDIILYFKPQCLYMVITSTCTWNTTRYGG